MASIAIDTERAIHGAAIIEMERPPNSRKLQFAVCDGERHSLKALEERTAIEKPGAQGGPRRVFIAHSVDDMNDFAAGGLLLVP